ncbi:uncharacterized protein LOC123271529 [Cotesia glomerata]|uniref:Uncharacterized protein n=1 Tax=Cotesia glomerata TaxID=32391 RepID=A0AAV7IVS3_COTGL|nr:uncharacterized protein LOC123271529 [Cotesia glomerata]KAH0558222.1 hypothetical protein KQX54_014967 [Cotesia glomerata]
MLIISLLVLIVRMETETAGLEIPVLTDMQDIIGLAHDIGDIASGNVPFLGLFTSRVDPVQAKLDGLSKQIEELSASFHLKMDQALSQILTNVPRETDFRVRMNQLGTYMARISFLFDIYQDIIKANSEYDKYSVEQFVNSATSLHDGDVIETLNQMHRLMTGNQDDDTQGSLFSVAAPVFASMDPSALCGRTMSRQQKAYDLHRTIVITEVKGFLMTTYAYGMLGIYRNRTFGREIRKAEERLISRVSDYIQTTKEGLVMIPRDVYVCDPPVHRFDKTFVELSRAIQMTVVHELHVLPSLVCDKSCSAVDSSKYYRFTVDASRKVYWKPKMICHGRITHCKDLGSSDICEFEIDEDDRETIDRLVYVDSTALGQFGDSERCGLARRSSLSYHMSLFRQCEPCLCTCFEEKESSTADRAFSLRPQVTDIDNNMVLTGIAFEKQDRLIHVQIEQGKLIKEGHIEKGSEKWVRLEQFDYTTGGSSWRGGFVRWEGSDKIEMVEEEDYVFIDANRRKIHLDDVKTLQDEYVVTGAKLKVSARDRNAIALSIRLTRFNYTTGELIAEADYRNAGDNDKINTKIHSVWIDDELISERKYRGDRTVLDVTDKQDPVRSYGNVPDSPDHSEITITHSSEREDVGQSTIPYFDRERSGPMPRVALDGLGLYHRGNGESGGFIGIKAFTFNLSPYLKPDIDPNLMRKGELESIREKQAIEELD